jgi:hypothetical protein
MLESLGDGKTPKFMRCTDQQRSINTKPNRQKLPMKQGQRRNNKLPKSPQKQAIEVHDHRSFFRQVLYLPFHLEIMKKTKQFFFI